MSYRRGWIAGKDSGTYWAEIRDTDGNIMSERMHEEVCCYWI